MRLFEVMKDHLKKIFISSILCLVMCICPSFVTGATSRTQAEAIQWVKSVVGQYLNMDGAYGAQCVDLILAYYDYLGVARSSGDAVDYTWNALPSGWNRIQGATPQMGDILVYAGNASNPYGHVAIFESTYSTYHQNITVGSISNSPVMRYTYAYNTMTNPYWGVIRPNFSSGSTSSDIIYTNIRTNFVDTWNAQIYGDISNPSRATVSQVGTFVWDSAGNLIVNHSENCSWNDSVGWQSLNIVDEALPTGLRSGETYTYQLWAVANGSRCYSGKLQFTTVDNEKPIITNVRITNVTEDGYTISCNVTDNYKVNRVQFPTWTIYNGQDDLAGDWSTNVSFRGQKNGNTYSFRVTRASHNSEYGIYRTHIYAFDEAGNSAVAFAPDITLMKENQSGSNSNSNTNTGKPTVPAAPAKPSTPAINQPGNNTVTISKPKKAKIVKLSSPKKKSLKVTWKKDAKVSGYQIQYSTSKKFTSKKTKSVILKSNRYTTKTIKKLSGKKTYYVRVRGYKKSRNTKVYGNWSSIKKIKVK